MRHETKDDVDTLWSSLSEVLRRLPQFRMRFVSLRSTRQKRDCLK